MFCESNFLWPFHAHWPFSENLSRKMDSVLIECLMVYEEMIMSSWLNVYRCLLNLVSPRGIAYQSFILNHRCSQYFGDGCGKFCQRRWSRNHILLQVRQAGTPLGGGSMGNVVFTGAAVPPLSVVSLWFNCVFDSYYIQECLSVFGTFW